MGQNVGTGTLAALAVVVVLVLGIETPEHLQAWIDLVELLPPEQRRRLFWAEAARRLTSQLAADPWLRTALDGRERHARGRAAPAIFRSFTLAHRAG